MSESHLGDDVPELTVSEAARIARLSADTIRRYSDSGKLRSFRTPSNQRRFRRSDVEALLTLSTATPTTSSPALPSTQGAGEEVTSASGGN